MNHYTKETKKQDGDVTDVIEEFDDELGNHVKRETITGPGFQTVRFTSSGRDSTSATADDKEFKEQEKAMD